MKVTQWFPPTDKPVHKGWYHTGFEDFYPNKNCNESNYNWYWNGKKWFATQTLQCECEVQNRWWRGMAK